MELLNHDTRYRSIVLIQSWEESVMLLKIIEKEIRNYISSSRFVFTFLLCTVLIMLAMVTGINSYRAELKEYSAAVALNEKNLETQPSYQALAGTGTKINKPPEVLGTIVSGIQNAVGRQSTVNIAYDPTLVESKYDSTPVLAVFGELDLTLIVKIVLSLFAILFTFDAIVGEREHGTLKLMLANRVPRDQVILGKVIGGFVSLLVPLIIPFGMSLLILMLYPDISLSGDDWARVGLMFVLFILYLSVFFALGLFVSTRSGSSVSSLFILLFVWVTFIFIVPKGAVIVAQNLKPIPSVHEITAQKDSFLQEIQGDTQKTLQDYLAQHSVETGTPEGQETLRAFLSELQNDATSRIDERNAELERDYQARRDAQRDLSVNLSLISPASALSFGAMSLARTGIDDHERFVNSVKTYKPLFTVWANNKLISSINMQNPNAMVTPEIDDMPRHSYVKSSFRDSVARAIPEFTVLALMIILFYAAAFVSFLRYDVR